MNLENDFASDSESDTDYCVERGSLGAPNNEKLSGKPEQKMYIKSLKHSVRTLRKPRKFEFSGNGHNVTDRDDLLSDEEADKSRSDALWADFLSDANVGSKTTQKTNYDAGKGVNIIKKSEVKVMEVKNTLNTVKIKKKPLGSRLMTSKRQLGKDKIGSLINKSDKKKKLSVLEISQIDWKNFKKNEGIDEKLRTYNKGKDGYLDRQDFLERTDLRQFEMEKNVRQSRRLN
ncbi:craniofacial development protein 1 [Drosophila biarmipes]|uniref:craniofacial development protein 1 n=1 Tax=Drosophila biarmipes TaxID=125945 RepID=UPI001CDB2E0C|nr:craniofacial development protein 1 [Drosophila biarmipes]